MTIQLNTHPPITQHTTTLPRSKTPNTKEHEIFLKNKHSSADPLKYDKNLKRKIHLMQNTAEARMYKKSIENTITTFKNSESRNNKLKEKCRQSVKKIDKEIEFYKSKIKTNKFIRFFYVLFYSPLFPDKNQNFINKLNNEDRDSQENLTRLTHKKTALVNKINEVLQKPLKTTGKLDREPHHVSNEIEFALSELNVLLKASDPKIEIELEEARGQIPKDMQRGISLNIENTNCTDPVQALKKLDEISPKNQIGKYTLFKLSTQSLPILLRNTTQAHIDEFFQQNPDDHNSYIVKDISKTKTINVIKKEDGTFQIKCELEHSVNKNNQEVFKLKSSITIELDTEGLITNSCTSHNIDKHSLNPSVPKITETVSNYRLHKFTTVKTNPNNSNTPVMLFDDFKKECVRLKGNLTVESDSIAKKHENTEKELSKSNGILQKLYDDLKYLKQKEEAQDKIPNQDKIVSQISPVISVLAEANIKLKEKYETDLVKDTIQTIADKLGPERLHLMPQISYLLGQNGAAEINEMLAAKYPIPLMKFLDFSFNLSIPEDNEEPVTITCTCRPKTDLDGAAYPEGIDIQSLNIPAIHGETVYLIYPNQNIMMVNTVK